MKLKSPWLAAVCAIVVTLPACNSSKSQGADTVEDAPAAPLQSIAGLRLALPGKPQKAEFGLSKDSGENTLSQESYVVQNGSTQYGLCKLVHRHMDGSLDDNARGIVDGHEGYSIVDMQVDGEQAKRITMEIAMDTTTQYVSILLFARGKTLWEIATIDPSITKAHGSLDALVPTIRILE